jgi:hypothetical protein
LPSKSLEKKKDAFAGGKRDFFEGSGPLAARQLSKAKMATRSLILSF